MKIFDRSILRLPLFEERHRRLASEIEAWADGASATLATPGGGSPSDVGRNLTRRLGAENWYAWSGAGGEAPDLRAVALIREGFAFVHDLCDFAFSIQALAVAPLVQFGSEAQRECLLPDLASGRKIGSFALSEPAVGSDVASVGLRAERRGNVYVLNGAKTWISNADIADFHTVLARTGEGPGAMGLSMIHVPADIPGLSVSEMIVLTAPRSIGTLTFEDCVVPEENLIGRPGLGFQIVTEVLEQYRPTVGAAAIGFARKARATALAWARSRRLTQGSVWDQQATKFTFADGEVSLTAAALLVAQATWEIDAGIQGYSKHSSIAKLFATEQAQKIVDDAVQTLGATGLVHGSPTETLYRQIRSLRIYEGTSEIQRMIIANQIGARL